MLNFSVPGAYLCQNSALIQYLIIIGVLVFISIVMLFLLSRSKRDTQELQQVSIKLSEVTIQLAERFKFFKVRSKIQLEQQAVKSSSSCRRFANSSE